MGETIEIDRLELIEHVLIPMQNMSLALGYILDGRIRLSDEELISGLNKLRTSSELISLFLGDLENGKTDDRALLLPSLIRNFVSKMIEDDAARLLTHRTRASESVAPRDACTIVAILVDAVHHPRT